MTEAQIVIGIMQNDNHAWTYLYRKMLPSFTSVISGMFSNGPITKEDIQDIFQDSCIVLMQKVKSGQLVMSREGALFSYLVQIGKLTAYNLLRKKSGPKSNDDSASNVISFVPIKGTAIPDLRKEQENEPGEISVSEKQKFQDEFLDRVFDSIPSDCKILLKKFYWDHKPMDEVASMMGLRNADTAKTKKNRCMNKFKEIATRLVNDGEYAEEAVRAAVERAALRELLEEERIKMTDKNIRSAALKIEDDKPEDK